MIAVVVVVVVPLLFWHLLDQYIYIYIFFIFFTFINKKEKKFKKILTGEVEKINAK